MSALPLIDPNTADTADNPAKPLLDTVQQRLGVVPNMTGAMANSPTYW